MLIAFVVAVPSLVAHALAPGRPILQTDWKTQFVIGAAVACQLIAAQWSSASFVLVPLSFLGGTIAIVRVVSASADQALLTWMAGIGGVANLIPIARHGAMPVRAASREAVSTTSLTEPSLMASKHLDMPVELRWQDPASLLTDWIPLPGLNGVISVGDVLLLGAFLGLGLRVRTRQALPKAPNMASAGEVAISAC